MIQAVKYRYMGAQSIWRQGFAASMALALTTAMFAAAPIRAMASDASEPVQASAGPSRMHVTGTRTAFSIDVDRADVLACIKAVFSQAGKQFDVDASAGGQITLQLAGQPLETALNSICKGAYLKYRIDSNTGIYHFEQDANAIKAAFARLQDLNAALRQQLRDMGLEVPDDALLNLAPGAGTRVKAPANSMRGGVGGGFGGGGRSTDSPAAAANGAPTLESSAKSAGQRSARAETGGQGRAGGQINTDFLPESFVRQFLIPGATSNSSISPQEFQNQYGNFLKQNGLVAINTNGNAVPMSDLFAELSRQTGTVILLDPSVPRGSKFRINLALPACTLTEALNVILPAAHLRWRTLNGSTYISATPDFQLFFGSQLTPGVIFGNSSNGVQGSLKPQQQGGLPPGKQN
jgi:hypothetical protein